MLIHAETHNKTMCRQCETLAISLLSRMSLSNPSPQGSGNLCRRGGGRIVKPEVVGGCKEPVSSWHSRISIHMKSQKLRQYKQDLHSSNETKIPAQTTGSESKVPLLFVERGPISFLQWNLSTLQGRVHAEEQLVKINWTPQYLVL